MTCVICSKKIPMPPPLRDDYLNPSDWGSAYKDWSMKRLMGACECRRCETCWGLQFRHVQGNRHKCKCGNTE